MQSLKCLFYVTFGALEILQEGLLTNADGEKEHFNKETFKILHFKCFQNGVLILHFVNKVENTF